MRRSLLVLGALVLAIVMAAPATAITKGGVADDGEHPYVGLSLYFSYDEVFERHGVVQHRCSGTLISPTVYVTAGHCTDDMDEAMLWFAEDVQTDQGSNGYPLFEDLPDDLFIENWGAPGHTVTGTPYTFPAYNPSAFFLNDLGVVILDQPLYLGTYGELPTAGQFADLHPGRHTTFTAVGYGLQWATGAFSVAEKVRLKANPWLIQIDVPGFTGDFAFLLSNNAAAGGTCFGDSGGPNFIGDTTTIAGITSFGLNGSCGGTGGVWRLDNQSAIDWINGF